MAIKSVVLSQANQTAFVKVKRVKSQSVSCQQKATTLDKSSAWLINDNRHGLKRIVTHDQVIIFRSTYFTIDLLTHFRVNKK